MSAGELVGAWRNFKNKFHLRTGVSQGSRHLSTFRTNSAGESCLDSLIVTVNWPRRKKDSHQCRAIFKRMNQQAMDRIRVL